MNSSKNRRYRKQSFYVVAHKQSGKIRSNGVVLFGGLAAVEGLEKFLVEALKMPVRLKLNSENSGVEGAKVYAEMINSQN